MLDTQQDVFEPSAADTVQAVMRFLRVLRYRRSYVLAAVGIAALLGALYYFTATPIYQATASLLILQTGAEVWNASMSPEGPSQALIPTYESLFYRDVVVKGAIHKLQQAPPETRVDLVGRPPNEWPDVIRGNLTAAAARRTNLIDISCRSKNPRAAEAIVEALTESYLEFMEKNHRDVSTEIVLILDKERGEIEGQLSQLQLECLKRKREARDLGLREGTDVVHPAVQRVVRLNETLVEVQQQRLQLQASLSAIRAAVHRGGDLRQHLITVEPMVGRELILSALGLNPKFTEAVSGVENRVIAERARLETLQAHYGPRHPVVVELVESIRNAEQYLADHQAKINDHLDSVRNGQLGPMLLSMVEEKLAEVWMHETEAAREYAEAESEAVDLNDRMAALAIVEHKLRLKQALHDTLLDRIANIDIHQDQADVRAAVVSEPKALNRPVSPKLSLVALLCLLGGLGGGALAVYVLDLLDDRFRSPEELKDQLGAPLLAVVRKLAARGDCGAQSLEVHVAATSVESEAFRTLRTALTFCGEDTERIVVTSPEPGDGKTTVLANLGASFAQAGKRTLLIDADMRRPGLTRLFQLRSSPGLSDALRSDQDAAEACQQRIHGTDVERLDVLPCGPKPSDPTVLLSGQRMSDLVAWAETAYDQVLIDCPPVLAASDAAIIGRLADGAVLVVQPEKNHRRLVLRAAESLRNMHVRVVGVVANHVSSEKEGGYYGSNYGYGYGYGYGSGYGDQEEATGDLEQDAAPEPAGQAAQHSVPRRAA